MANLPDTTAMIQPWYLRGDFAGIQNACLLGRLEPETKTLLRKSIDGGQN